MRRWSRGILALCVVAGLAASVCISRGVFAHSPFSHAGKAPATGIAPGISSNLATCGSHWSVVASPDTGTQNANQLNGIAAVSASDIWAVGYDWTGIGYDGTGITEHWNGSTWSIVASPNPSNQGYLFWVTAITANDVVAVGYSSTSSLIEHWNGSVWSLMPSPNVGSTLNHLIAVTALSPTDLWAVGEDRSGTNPRQTLALHYRTLTRAGPGGTSAAAVSGAHIPCPLTPASATSSAAAPLMPQNPRWQLMQSLRSRVTHRLTARCARLR